MEVSIGVAYKVSRWLICWITDDENRNKERYVGFGMSSKDLNLSVLRANRLGDDHRCCCQCYLQITTNLSK